MNKTTKGALGASAAAVLLLGGAGSLAYWTDGATVNGGEVNSGFLTLDNGTCDASFVHGNGLARGTVVKKIVPGDVITKTCTFTIGADGDNLSATLATAETATLFTKSGNTAESLSLPVDYTYKLDGAAFPDTGVVTDKDKDQVLVATIEVKFPYGTPETVVNGAAVNGVNDNDTQNLLVKLDDLSVTLKQINNGV